MKYNIGQEVTFTKDLKVDTGFSKSVIKQGETGIVTASRDYPSIRLRNGKYLYLNKDEMELVGYDTENIAKFILKFLLAQLPLDDSMSDYELTESDFAEVIEEALEELNFYEGKLD